MDFILQLQNRAEVISSITYMIIGIIGGCLSTSKSRLVRWIGTAILALSGIAIILILYIDDWRYLLLGIIVVIIIIFIPLIPIIFKRNYINRKRIGKILINATKNADANCDMCMFCGDIDFLGQVSAKTNSQNIECNKQYIQIKEAGINIK